MHKLLILLLSFNHNILLYRVKHIYRNLSGGLKVRFQHPVAGASTSAIQYGAFTSSADGLGHVFNSRVSDIGHPTFFSHPSVDLLTQCRRWEAI